MTVFGSGHSLCDACGILAAFDSLLHYAAARLREEKTILLFYSRQGECFATREHAGVVQV